MSIKPIEDVLEHIPKRTPTWAVGLVTIMTAIVASFVTVYLLSREDIQSWVSWAEKHHEFSEYAEFQKHEAMDAATVRRQDVTLASVLNLVNANSAQIVDLSKNLGATQQQNVILTERVTQLEKTLSTMKDSLRECEGKLFICINKGK